jgi:hypothetical protein
MGIVRVVLTGQAWATINCQNVLAFDTTLGYLTNEQVAWELRDNWCTILAAGQTNQFGWRNISVKELGSAAAPFNLPIVVNGQDGVDPGTGTQVICQKFRIHTGVAGRTGRGRIYLPGYRANLVSYGQLNSTGIENMTIRLNAIKARYVLPAASGPLLLGVCKRGDISSNFMPATDLSLSLVPGVQRRRTLGLGI